LREEFAEADLPEMRRWMDFARGRWSRAYDRVAAEEQPGGLSRLLMMRAVWIPLDARLPGIEDDIERALAQDSTSASGAWAALFPHRKLYTAALLSLQAGDTETGVAYADSAAALPIDSTLAPVVRNMVRTVRGEAALRADDVPTARAELEALEWEMAPVAEHALRHLGIERAHFLRAEAAWRDGDVEAAHRWFEHGRADTEDYSLLELRRGQVQEALGNLERARIHYARVVEALEPADEELIPRRDEARARLAALLEAGS
ncbi:MAG TPA: hypothetical protein VLA33_02560, partial [Gemmatimonadota bacterium]|nr:hypothetical protein [Gemmatimonadota bacterium]